jgi:hypothetical protein
MRKIILCFIISVTFLSCKGQNKEFDNYISNFREIKLPFLVDRRDSINRTYVRASKEIPINYIKKYICLDSTICDYNPEYYNYNYRYKIKESANIIAVLLSKGKYEGETCYDFDLGETLLIVYTKDGKIIDEKSIAKNNDCWLSTILVTSDSIVVQQIKISDPSQINDPEVDCEIETTTYQISDEGYIKTIRTEPIKKGVLVWDKKIYDYILKK